MCGSVRETQSTQFGELKKHRDGDGDGEREAERADNSVLFQNNDPLYIHRA